MQKKKFIVTGIGVVVVIVGILGGVMLHKDGEAVETMAEAAEPTEETVPPITEEDSTVLKEEVEPKTVENTDTEETFANTADTEQETDVSQEDESEQEKAERNAAEISQNDDVEEIDAYMYTTADLNMRKEGTTESEVIASIPYGTQIHVTARTADNWYRTERGESGYVSGKYLSEEEPAPQQQARTSHSGIGGYNRYGEYIEGVSQEDLDLLDALIPDYEPYTGPTSSNAGGGSGGRRLDGTNAWE